MTLHRLAATAILIATGLTITQGADQQRPEFRGGIELVTVDVTALGPDGWPVAGLRPDELTLTVNGHARAITSLQYIEVAPRLAPGAAATEPPAFASNLPTNAGRSVFIVVLHDHIRPGNERAATQGALKFIDQLTPRDRVALLTMPFGRVEVDLTADHEKVKARLAKISGHSTEAAATGKDQTSEAQALLEFLKGLVPLDGPKTVVLISEGFNSGSLLFGAAPDPTSLMPDTGFAMLLDRASRTAEIGDLRTAAAAARAQFFVLQPHNFAGNASLLGGRMAEQGGLVAQSQIMESQTSALASVATTTGGQFFQVSASATPVFDRILRETSGYYALAFEADAADRAGKDRRIEIRTSHPGVTLRARRTFPAPRASSGKTVASARAMLKDAVSYPDVPLRVTAYTTRGSGDNVKVLAVADTAGPEPLKEMAFVLVGPGNKVAAEWPADMPAPGAPAVGAQMVAPGHYRLRAAAVDSSGHGGAADFEFDAGLQTMGPLSAASLMLGRAERGAFQPRMVFAAGEEVTAYVEIYGTAGDLTAVFELRRPFDDKPIVTASADIAPTRDADRRIVTGALSLASLGAGDYIVRASIATAGRETGVVSRTLRIAARSVD